MNENEKKFDQQMIDLLSEVTPSELELSKMNPWSKPIGLITWGLIMTTIRFTFLNLDYILPTIGVLLIFLGFRSLRSENNFFRLAWALSILKLIIQLADLIRISTPLNTLGYPVEMGMTMMLLQILLYLLYHMALKEVFGKAGKTMEEAPLIWAAFWTGAAFLMAVSPFSTSWLLFIPMMVIYYAIIKSLSGIGEQLDDTGYFLTNAPVRISNQYFGWGYIALSLMIVIACSMNFSHLRLESREHHMPLNTEVREKLLEMDFPSEALMYLKDEDVEKLTDARAVEVQRKTLMFDPKRVEHVDTSESGFTQISYTYDPGESNAEIASIYIEMPGNMMYVMHYYIWTGGSPHWQDGLTISGESEVENKEIVSSGLFYRKNGMLYTAGFPRLINEEVTVNSMLGTYRPTLILGAFSYPFDSEDQGGYVLQRYKVLSDTDIFSTHSTFSYVHQTSPIHIPFEKTENVMLNGGYIFEDELQQHNTTYESAAVKERGK